MNKVLQYLLMVVGSFGFYLFTGDGSEALLLLILLIYINVLKTRQHL